MAETPAAPAPAEPAPTPEAPKTIVAEPLRRRHRSPLRHPRRRSPLPARPGSSRRPRRLRSSTRRSCRRRRSSSRRSRRSCSSSARRRWPTPSSDAAPAIEAADLGAARRTRPPGSTSRSTSARSTRELDVAPAPVLDAGARASATGTFASTPRRCPRRAASAGSAPTSAAAQQISTRRSALIGTPTADAIASGLKRTIQARGPPAAADGRSATQHADARAPRGERRDRGHCRAARHDGHDATTRRAAQRADRVRDAPAPGRDHRGSFPPVSEPGPATLSTDPTNGSEPGTISAPAGTGSSDPALGIAGGRDPPHRHSDGTRSRRPPPRRSRPRPPRTPHARLRPSSPSSPPACSS